MNKVFNIPKTSVIRIKGTDYKILNRIKFKDKAYTWVEYSLIDKNNNKFWLSIEMYNNSYICSFYKEIQYILNLSPEIYHNDKIFKKFDEGTAVVIESDSPNDTKIGDTFNYYEYIEDSKTSYAILSIEIDEDMSNYFEGEILNNLEIFIDGVNIQKFSTTLISNYNSVSLKLYQVLKIKGIKYIVTGYTKFKQGSFEWIEYKLNADGDIYYLSVEKIDSETILSLFKMSVSSSRIDAGAPNILYDRTEYHLLESGQANVCGYKNVDVDYNERVFFYEYENKQTKKLLSIEDWDGEREISEGEYINLTDIYITDDIEKPKVSKITMFIYGIVLVSFFPVILSAPFNFISSFFNKSQLSNNFKNYTYVTSITSNYKNSLKANIYKTHKSVDEEITLLINKYPETIVDVATTSKDPNDVNDTTSLQLPTNSSMGALRSKHESVLIYLGSDEIVYIQVSNLNYAKNADSFYKEMYPYMGDFYSESLKTAYLTSSTTSSYRTGRSYTSHHRSSRTASINSRKSSGGGTSSGK